MAGRLQGKQPVVVRIPQSAGADAINNDWRARDKHREVEYNIRTIVPSTDRLWLDLMCESGVAT